MTELLKGVAELSREFGTPDYVLAGGGNTSAKDDEHLWIKPSGTCLPDMTPESFLQMDRSGIGEIYEANPPEDVNEREAMVGDMLMKARSDQERDGRPSVETPLHNTFSGRYVVHVHPVMVAGMLCSVTSKETCAELFPGALYMGYTDPGYTLCMKTRAEIMAFKNRTGKEPSIVFMENHGLFVAGDTVSSIRSQFSLVMSTLAAVYEKKGIKVGLDIGAAPDDACAEEVRRMTAEVCGDEHAKFAKKQGVFPVSEGPLTPDHIVYMKAYPLIGAPAEDNLKEFIDTHGYSPRIISTDMGVVALGSTERNAELALMLAEDGALTVKLAEAFGGVRYLDKRAADFIDNWEVEAYRRKVAS